MPRRTFVLLIAAVLFLTGCRPDVVVEIVSRIYTDGSLHRQVTITGKDRPEAEPPEAVDWLRSKTGLVLARPGDWDRVEAGPGTMEAEGVFLRAVDAPPVLAHLDGDDVVPDRQEIRLRQDDLVILTRYRLEERFGDPFGQDRVDAAVARMLEIAGEIFREELTAMYGDRADLGGVQRFLHEEAGPMIQEFLGARRTFPGPERLGDRTSRWNAILERYQVPLAEMPETGADDLPPDFWELQTGPLLAWARERLAARVSTEQEVVEPGHLRFIPTMDNLEEDVQDLLVERYGSEEAALEELEPLFQAIEGHYASGGAPLYRFRCRLSLPGILLRTNGVREDRELVWFFRGSDIAAGEVVLSAESVEPNLEALRALSARRSFEAADLLNLVDILGEEDPEGRLAGILTRSVEAGSLKTLEEAEEDLPADLVPLARELTQILRRD